MNPCSSLPFTPPLKRAGAFTSSLKVTGVFTPPLKGVGRFTPPLKGAGVFVPSLKGTGGCNRLSGKKQRPILPANRDACAQTVWVHVSKQFGCLCPNSMGAGVSPVRAETFAVIASLRSNPENITILDCFVTSFLAMTVHGACTGGTKNYPLPLATSFRPKHVERQRNMRSGGICNIKKPYTPHRFLHSIHFAGAPCVPVEMTERIGKHINNEG